MEKKAVGIVVGGGPAPGINGVICAATIEAINRGHRVFGIRYGFSRLMEGDGSTITELTIRDVSRIDREGGSVLATSRANPTKSPQYLKNVVETLQKFNIGYLVTIGGDDTASSAQAIAKAAAGKIAVGHVPKTIDNDLPLPGKSSTFGFQSAREVGTGIVETLMVDARSTSRWYLVVAMGRKAGHLALGIGVSASATITIIPEQFGFQKITLSQIVDIVVGSILKRLAHGQPYGVAVLAEGLAEILDVDSIPELASAERDPHGHIRFAEVDFGGMVKRAVRARLEELGTKAMVVDKNVGYELRCHPANPFDREYTRLLGFGIITYLLNGGTEAMISRQEERLIPIPFRELIDPATGRARVRVVDMEDAIYRVACKYMIRLNERDLQDSALIEKMAQFTKVSSQKLVEELRHAAVPDVHYADQSVAS